MNGCMGSSPVLAVSQQLTRLSPSCRAGMPAAWMATAPWASRFTSPVPPNFSAPTEWLPCRPCRPLVASAPWAARIAPACTSLRQPSHRREMRRCASMLLPVSSFECGFACCMSCSRCMHLWTCMWQFHNMPVSQNTRARVLFVVTPRPDRQHSSSAYSGQTHHD